MRDGEPDCALEVSPLYATSAEQLQQKNLAGKQIQPGQAVYFGPKGSENS
jgi:hypothetical protein